MPYQNVNGVQIYYELHGPQDAEVIVLSNGIFMSTASWGYQVAGLKDHFRVLLYDCRGMWQSEHPAGPYSMEQHADDLAELMAGLGISKAHIAGISYGGEISMVFACRYPERVRSLIVSSAVSQIDPLLETIGKSWSCAIQSGDPNLLFHVTVPFNFSEEWIGANLALLEASRKRFEQLDLQAASELMAAFSKVDFSADLHQINAPALVLVGELDAIKPRKYAEIIAGEIAGAELVVIPHAGHAVFMEKPDIFNTLLTGFALKHREVQA
jgi:3-oxoadipate enol-lactonase